MSEWGEAMEMARDRWDDERAELVAALKACVLMMEGEYEQRATNMAAASPFGVSEWRAFMPQEYHQARAALAKAEESNDV